MPYNAPVDPAQIGPGWWNLAVFVVLLATTVALLFSLVRHLKRIDRNQPPSGGAQPEKNPPDAG